MQISHNQDLVRKQFYISKNQTKKLAAIAKKHKKSSAEIVRLAIDAYNPESTNDMEASELMELVSARLKDAIADTRKTRMRLDKTLTKFEAGVK